MEDGYMDEWDGVDGWYIKTIIAFRPYTMYV